VLQHLPGQADQPLLIRGEGDGAAAHDVELEAVPGGEGGEPLADHHCPPFRPLLLLQSHANFPAGSFQFVKLKPFLLAGESYSG
jgi:hypothetical protein